MAYGPRGDYAADKGFAGGEGGGHDGFVRARGRRESFFLPVTSHSGSNPFSKMAKACKFHPPRLAVL